MVHDTKCDIIRQVRYCCLNVYIYVEFEARLSDRTGFTVSFSVNMYPQMT